MTSGVDSPVRHHESGHYRYRPRYLTRRAARDDHLLIWVVGGELSLELGGITHHVRTGELAVLRAGVPHAYTATTESGWEWLWCHFAGPGSAALLDLLGPEPIVPVGTAPLIRSRFDELVASASVDGGAVGALRLDSCLFSLLGLLVDLVHAEPVDAVARLSRWVTDHLADPFTLADLATAARRSPAQVSRIVRTATGSPPMAWAARIKLREAERLLTTTDLGVAEVARRVGFADPLHFSRRFTQLTGRSPSASRLVSPARGYDPEDD